MDGSELQELHLSDYLQVIKRRWWIILACLLGAIYFFWVPVLRQYPAYKASGSLQMEEEKGGGPGLGQNLFPEFFWMDKWMNNQINIMKSKKVTEKVARKLNLRLKMRPSEPLYKLFLRDFLYWSKASPLLGILPKGWTSALQKWDLTGLVSSVLVRPLQVDNQAKEGYYRGVFRDPRHFVIYDGEGRALGKGELGRPFEGPQFSCIVEGVGREGTIFEFDLRSELQAALELQGSLIITSVKESTMIQVGVRWNEPIMAREIVNTTMEAYQETLVTKKADDVSQGLTYVENQLRATEEILHRAEEDLRKFKGREKIVDLDIHVRSKLEQATNYERELRNLISYRKQAEIVLGALKSPKVFSERESLFSLGAGLQDPLITSWGQKLSDLLVQRSALLTLYTDEHPKVRQIDQEIIIIKRSIMGGVSGLISSLKIKEKGLQEILDKIEKQVQHIPAMEQESFMLQRVVKVNQGVTEFLLQRRAELSVRKASVLSNIYFVEPAHFPGVYVGPDMHQKLLITLLIGLALGIGLAFFMEYFDTTIKTPEQAQRVTGLPNLGSIYHFVPQRKSPEASLQMLEAPFSHLAEAFRTIKTSIVFACSVGEPRKLILITSSAPSEGKTFVAANLGVAFAQSGKRVLLVETDLRNPCLHPIFGYESSPGLSNALLDPVVDFSNLPIRQTMVENLDFLAAGDKPPNPSELLCSDKMERVFTLLREQYDFVLFDSPPVFLTSDPIILAQRVDGVVLVARSGETKKEILRETVERLLRVEAKILGILFNDISPQRKKYYYHKYRHYYTEERGRKKKEKEPGGKKYEGIKIGEMKVADLPRGEEDSKEEAGEKKRGGIKMGEMKIEDFPRGEEDGKEKEALEKKHGGIKMGEMKIEDLPGGEKNDLETPSWDVNSWEIKEQNFQSENVRNGGIPNREMKNGFINGKVTNGDKKGKNRKQIIFPPAGKGKNR